MTRKISKETQQRLLSAIEKTASLVSDGGAPDTAMAKAAKDCGVRPGEINQLVYAYNTGRTARQRADGNDPLEKVADFQLADASNVLELLYPSRTKTAAEESRDVAVSTQYALPPTGLLQRRSSREKAARHVDWSLGEKAPKPYPSDPKHKMRKASSAVDRLNREVAELRRQKAAAFDDMGEVFTKLGEYFRQPGCRSIPVVRENVRLMHGDKGEQIFEQLLRITPGLTKLASHRTGSSLLYDHGSPASALSVDPNESVTGEPYTIVRDLVGKIQLYKQAKAAHSKREADVRQQAEVLLAPFAPAGLVSESVLGRSSTEKRAVNPLQALGAVSLVKNTLGGVASSMKKPDDSQVQATLDELEDPEHDQQLRNIQAEAGLQRAMSEDDVIGSHDPEEVMQAYNDLVQLTPRMANQPLLMRSMLRKQLEQGSLDQYEVDQLLGAEQKLQGLDVSPQGAPSGGTSNPGIKGVGADGTVL